MSIHYVRPRQAGKLYATTTVNLMLSWGGILGSYAPKPWLPEALWDRVIKVTNEAPTEHSNFPRYTLKDWVRDDSDE